MRLVEQTTLVFTRGRTEKVYEIDLCALGPDRFVVNYRYGRRGSALKEGTQTVDPVPEARARAAYRALIDQKVAQGYVAGASHAPAPEPEPPPEASPVPSSVPSTIASPMASPVASDAIRPPRVADPRAQGVLDRLARGDRAAPAAAPSAPDAEPVRSRREIQAMLRAQRRGRGGSRGRERATVRRGDRTWSLTRAIWRAGELKLGEATPLLLALLAAAPAGDDLRRYCLAWALGRCGDASAIEPLRRLHRDPMASPKVARIAAAALLELLPAAERETFARALLARLPAALQTDDPEALTAALRAHLAGPAGEDGAPTPLGSPDRKQWAAVETLYLAGPPAARAAVDAILAEAPLRPPAFQRVRAVFKLAELRRDGRLFGRVAHRFATTRAMFDVGRRGRAIVTRPDGGTQRVRDPQQALSRADATLAYGSKTRSYLRRRVWHTLRRMGELDDTDYVPMAVGVLLAFTDADGRGDDFGHYWAFNHILHGNSDRYQRGRLWWRVRTTHRRDRRRREDGPPGREEAFPHLWDRVPAGLMQLIDGSRCRLVHTFAAKALRAQRAFLDALPAEAIALIVGAPYGVSARLGFDLARARFERFGAAPADRRVLAAACADCVVADLRREAHRWLRHDPRLLLDAPGLLARLAASRHEDTRGLVRELLRPMRFDAATADALLGALVGHLMGLDDPQTAAALVALVESVFGDRLRGLAPAVVTDLARHPLATVQGFAARLMASRAVPIAPPALTALLESSHDEARVLGLRLLGLLDDGTLLEATDLLWSSLTHRDADVRDAIRPTVARLAQRDPAFADRFLQMLVASLLRRRLPDGVPAFVVTVLREDFAAGLARVPAEIAWRLLRSNEGAAQELGGLLLPRHLDPDTVPVPQLAELAGHEVKAVREAAWRAMEAAVDRLRADPAEAVAVLDSRWEDTRLFAFELFDRHFTQADFAGEDGAATLVSICDSVRPDVQRFGRHLVAKHFDPSHGKDYLLMLSEHPSADVQLFASNYLRDHAAGDAQALAALAPYFVRVLCGINRGRVAKRRAHAFLRDEALADEACARVVAGILARQSATTAIEDRAACIETMTAIAHRWPDVELPLTLVEPARRAPVAEGA